MEIFTRVLKRVVKARWNYLHESLISIMVCFIAPKLKGTWKGKQLIELICTQLQNTRKLAGCYSTFWGQFSALSIFHLSKSTHSRHPISILTLSCNNATYLFRSPWHEILDWTETQYRPTQKDSWHSGESDDGCKWKQGLKWDY